MKASSMRRGSDHAKALMRPPREHRAHHKTLHKATNYAMCKPPQWRVELAKRECQDCLDEGAFFFLLISLHKHANTSGRAFLDPEGLGVGRFCYQLTPAAVLHDDPSKSPLLGLPNVEAVPIAGPVLSSLKVQ